VIVGVNRSSIDDEERLVVPVSTAVADDDGLLPPSVDWSSR
jgi:hypothetical protein